MPREQVSVKLITFLSGFEGITAYSVILGVLLACGLGVPMPEDITLVAAGILAGLKNISLTGAMIVGIVGVLLGDAILFFMGRKYGYKVFALPGFRRVFTESRIALARQRILQNEKSICFMARFLPGLRAPIYLTAGIMGVRPIIFLTLDGIAAMISVPFWIYIGYHLGDNLDDTLRFVMKTQKWILIAVGTALALLIVWHFYRRRQMKSQPAPDQKIAEFTTPPIEINPPK
jgi:membrane protein DedA with SNARE-associated domain